MHESAMIWVCFGVLELELCSQALRSEQTSKGGSGSKWERENVLVRGVVRAREKMRGLMMCAEQFV